MCAYAALTQPRNDTTQLPSQPLQKPSNPVGDTRNFQTPLRSWRLEFLKPPFVALAAFLMVALMDHIRFLAHRMVMIATIVNMSGRTGRPVHH
jgi:hypothetical protein